MITVQMVPADILIPKLAEYLKNNVKELNPPNWVYFAKTASFKERVPDDIENWWYIRAASLLRHLYIYKEPIGLQKTRKLYTGSKRRGTKPPRSVKAPTHSIRTILQQLEKAGLVTKTRRGRSLSPKGRSLLDKLAYEMFKELAEKKQDLKKYLQ
ncbi:30S ribosomal protein S19 [Sulfolobus acidocaldarius SUSAZ]|nr:30S ribosomal protein S19 [Sulfolobus acidocaldarius SUSAZ]